MSKMLDEQDPKDPTLKLAEEKTLRIVIRGVPVAAKTEEVKEANVENKNL